MKGISKLRALSLIAAALTVAPAAIAQQQRGNVRAVATAAQGHSQAARPATVAGHPNLNGVWQAIGTAYWNLEDHSAAATKFWQLGALFAIPPGQSVVVGGSIPYLPEALKQREENRKEWPGSDPETKCYMAGIPRATYMPYPFEIVQGQKDILFVYEYATSNRIVHMDKHTEAPVDSWMGWSNGHWDGNTLVIEVTGQNDQTWFDRAGNHHSDELKVTERYTLVGDNQVQYEATMDDPRTFARPWTIRMPLYRDTEPDAQLLEYRCVEFAEKLLYEDETKK